jgi:chaperonin GroES
MAKDSLAQGAKSASFMMPTADKNSPIELRNVAPEEPLQSHVDNSAMFARKKPSIIYRGKPIGEMVLVKRIERESNSAIILPDSAKGKSDMGIVVSAGDGAIDQLTGMRTPLNVREGEMILFDKFAAVGMEITLMDEHGDEAEHLILREHDILLILEARQRVEQLTQ